MITSWWPAHPRSHRKGGFTVPRYRQAVSGDVQETPGHPRAHTLCFRLVNEPTDGSDLGSSAPGCLSGALADHRCGLLPPTKALEAPPREPCTRPVLATRRRHLPALAAFTLFCLLSATVHAPWQNVRLVLGLPSAWHLPKQGEACQGWRAWGAQACDSEVALPGLSCDQEGLAFCFA